jgi:prophage DNA circulation protein
MSTDAVTLAAIADADAIFNILADFASTIDFTASVAAATTSTGAVTLAEVAGLSILADIAVARSNLAQLVAVPASLAATLVALIQDFRGTGVDYRAVSDRAASIVWASQIPAAGLGSAQILANRAALSNLLAIQGLVEAVRAATSMTYDSQDAALAMRDDLANRLDAAFTASPSRPLRATLDGLRVALVLDINTRAAALASLQTITPAQVLPALVLAQIIYDDPTMAGDICARNAVIHPGFVPATALTVLAP